MLDFNLPLSNAADYFSSHQLEEKVVVVSFIGKKWNGKWFPPSEEYEHIIKNINAPKDESDDIFNKSRIVGRYLPMQNVLYIALQSPCNQDLSNPTFLEKLEKFLESEVHFNDWDELKKDFAYCLLFLFSFSHIVVFNHGKSQPIFASVKLLKILSFARTQFQNHVRHVVTRNTYLNDSWIFQGRFCSPRLLFVFECPAFVTEFDREVSEDFLTRIRTREHHLEDQIYALLRSNRLAKNLCQRAFFSIAPNDEFVFLETKKEINYECPNYQYQRCLEYGLMTEELEYVWGSSIYEEEFVNMLNDCACEDQESIENDECSFIYEDPLKSPNDTKLDWDPMEIDFPTIYETFSEGCSSVLKNEVWPFYEKYLSNLEEDQELVPINENDMSTNQEDKDLLLAYDKIVSYEAHLRVLEDEMQPYFEPETNEFYQTLYEPEPDYIQQPMYNAMSYIPYQPVMGHGEFIPPPIPVNFPTNPYFVPTPLLQHHYPVQVPDYCSLMGYESPIYQSIEADDMANTMWIPQDEDNLISSTALEYPCFGRKYYLEDSLEPYERLDSNILEEIEENVQSENKGTLKGVTEYFLSNQPDPWGLTDIVGQTQEPVVHQSHSFESFLQKHVQKAHKEAFNDNLVKYTVTKTYFDRPLLRQFFTATTAILEYSDVGVKDKSQYKAKYQDRIDRLLTPEVQFSTSRCKKIIHLALASYQEHLPSFYSQSTHDKHFRKAVNIFKGHARGPAQKMYLKELKHLCDDIWIGRQTCEACSLYKNSCAKSLNHLTNNKNDEHCSSITHMSSCNCGFTQKSRIDPFTVKQANLDFYQEVGKECSCLNFEKFNFPVFQPSSDSYKAADIENSDRSSEHSIIPLVDSHTDLQSGHTSSPTITNRIWVEDSALSQGLDLTPPSDQECDFDFDFIPNSQTDKQLLRQASTTEYLPCMLYEGSPPGLLPLFSSWSLVCRGPSSLYSHNLGLSDQMNFLTGSNFLLPWDISLKERNTDSFKEYVEALREKNGFPTFICRNGQKKIQRISKDSCTIKIFIGMEYECLKGHRFMSYGPGKVLKVGSNGIVKDNASRIAKGNMPLFMLCPCGNTPAQLMRIHVVTPKAPVLVTLNPRVRPETSPCPVFISGVSKPIELSQSSYWVLRLPVVYATERKTYVVPSRPKKGKHGELIGPLFGIKNQSL